MYSTLHPLTKSGRLTLIVTRPILKTMDANFCQNSFTWYGNKSPAVISFRNSVSDPEVP